MQETWLIYALGGGWGHLARALALGRVAARERNIIILTNSPYGKWVDSENCEIIVLSPELDQKSAIKTIQKILTTTQYHCLIVDTFPRGLVGELADFLPHLNSTPRVLIHRDLTPRYVAAKQLPEFVQQQYDLVLAVEAGKLPFSELSITCETSPWLLRNSDELPHPETLCSSLKLNPEERDKKLILILASGRDEELELYGRLTKALIQQQHHDDQVRCLSVVKPPFCPSELWCFYFPAIACLSLADCVIGSGGYNTVHECQALGIPLLAFPFSRLYDRQRDRVKRIQSGVTLVNRIESVINHSWLQNKTRQNRPFPPQYINGVSLAIKKIETLITEKRS